jgi:predicted permease
MTRVRRFFNSGWQDVRFSARLLFKERGFATTALLTLAICIGANAAMFSVVRSVVLKPLPVPNSSRIVAFHNNYPKASSGRGSTGAPDYFDRRAQMDVFDELALYRRQGMTLGGKDGAVRLTTLWATPSWFRLVSATPVLGRVFTEDEGEFGREQEVLLSAALWQREFGGARDVVGTSIRLSGAPYQVVGVLPADFTFLDDDIDAYIPASFGPKDTSDASRHTNNWNMIAMLKPGMGLERAKAEVDAINARNDARFPEIRQALHDAGFYTSVVYLQDDLIKDIRPVLLLLWGGVVFVLLIGCLNIANLVLVRASSRTRELATRQAIGAGIGRLSRQLLTETTLLASAGGVAGLLLGWGALRLMPMSGLEVIPRGREIALDPASAAVVLGAALVVGVVIGIVPLLRLRHLDVNSALRDEARGGSASRSTSLVRRGLATAQVTIAFVLLIGAGLLAVSFRQTLRLDTGFDAHGVVTGAVVLPSATYGDARLVPVAEDLVDSIRAIPGVTAAGITSTVPLSGSHNDSLTIPEGRHARAGESLVSPDVIFCSDGYLEAIGTPLVRGRVFTRADNASAQRVAIVDERLARHFWPGQDPLGRRVYQPANADEVTTPGPKTQWLTVVGVVKEVQLDELVASTPAVGAVYLPTAQNPPRALGLVVRSSTDGRATIASVRKALAALDPALPLFAVRSMEDYVDQALMPRRLPMLLAGGFAVVALLLSAVGVYGVLAYGVAQRRREIGIRLALGSTAMQAFGLVFREGLAIVALGLVLGLAGLGLLRRALTAVLYGVGPFDPVVIAIVTIALSVVALMATMIPARRAARVDPARAMGD